MQETKITDQYKGVPGKVALSQDEHIAAWQRLQYGMFIHWGLYSELGGRWQGEDVTKGYSEQIQMWANIDGNDYAEVAKAFNAEQFDPKEICQLAKDAGMEYIVITSKHHDGFAMFDTGTTDYNIVKQTPFGKDALKLLADECERQGLKFGVYFSLIDWHAGHPFDKNNNNTIPESMNEMIEAQLRELMTGYGPIAEVWFDMSSPSEAQSVKFKNIVHELQPGAAVNGRIWNNQGDFRTLGDNQVPEHTLEGAWQTPASIYSETWGYRKWQTRDEFKGKVRDLTVGLTSVIARGGNYLLNIGPRGDGSIVPFEADVLREMGTWINRHQGAVLSASGTSFGGQPWGEVTVNEQTLYLHVMDWPKDQTLTLPGLATDVGKIVENGYEDELEWHKDGYDLIINLPEKPKDSILPVIAVQLSGNLEVIPAHVVLQGSDHAYHIKSENMHSRRSYADRGNYNSLVRTTVQQSAYFANEADGHVQVTIDCSVGDESRDYRVKVGDTAIQVSGDALNGTPIGPFPVKKDEIVPLIVGLDKPEHINEDMNVTCQSIHVQPIENLNA